MKYRRKLLLSNNLYDINGKDELFVSAMKEITSFHIEHNAEYKKICFRQNFSIDDINSIDDLYRIPALPTLYLKRHTLFTTPVQKMVVKATTSGTSGHKSVVGLDLNTGYYALRMVLKSFRHFKLFSFVPTNYIILGYQPNKNNRMGIAKTAYGFTFITPTIHREYALKYKDGGYHLDIESLIERLIKYEKQGFPVRLMGLPAYHHLLLSTLKERNIKLKLHPKSYLCLGGGWKQYHFEHADKGELYQLANEVLGIDRTHCIDFFGAVEHPILYCDCPNKHFHVPVYCRVIIRDVNTLKPVGFGKEGILNLLSPMMKSMPFHSIMTDDLAVLHEGCKCGCGNEAPYFELLGRAGLQDIKTCAANASQYLEQVNTVEKKVAQ